LNGGEISGFFSIGEKDKQVLLYSPDKGIAVKLKKDELSSLKKKETAGKELSERIEEMQAVRIGGSLLQGRKDSASIGLLLTTACNSDCLYCYAKSRRKPISMDFETAKKGIDFVTKNQPGSLELLFHGGEPTLELNLMKKVKRYAEQKSKNVFVDIQSGGVFSGKVLDWLKENAHSVKISCDGPPEIQDMQRPLKSPRKSSQIVENNIKALAENPETRLSVKATVTRHSVNRLVEVVEYFNRLGAETISMDPFIKCEESELNGLKPVNPLDFSANFLKAREFAEKIGVQLFSSFLPIYRRTYACGFCIPQFCLTPDGLVSACLAKLSSAIGPQEFAYGRLSGKGFEFDERKIKRISGRRIQNMEACNNCFLRHTCLGGCAAECLMETGSIFTPSKEKCLAVRETVKKYIESKAEKELGNRSSFLRNESGREYLPMHFSDFELSETVPSRIFSKNPLVKISLSRTDLEKLRGKMTKYREKKKFKPVFFALRFDVSERDLVSGQGVRVWEFLEKLKNNKVRFFVSKTFFPCMFETGYQKFLDEFSFFDEKTEASRKTGNAPGKCRECVYFFRGRCRGFFSG